MTIPRQHRDGDTATQILDVAEQLAAGTGAELVQVLGKTVVLYRPSSTNRQIRLP